jgi:hypothetical protein
MRVAVPAAALLGGLVVSTALEFSEKSAEADQVAKCESAAQKLRIEGSEARQMCGVRSQYNLSSDKALSLEKP